MAQHTRTLPRFDAAFFKKQQKATLYNMLLQQIFHNRDGGRDACDVYVCSKMRICAYVSMYVRVRVRAYWAGLATKAVRCFSFYGLGQGRAYRQTPFLGSTGTMYISGTF